MIRNISFQFIRNVIGWSLFVLMDYKIWKDFYQVLTDYKKVGDAVSEQKLMDSEFAQVQSILNRLWTKPIDDIEKLFELRNKTLQEKYNIEFL